VKLTNRSSIADLQPVTASDAPRLDDVGIDTRARQVSEVTEVEPVLIDKGAQDAGVVRQIGLGQGRHHAARARDGDAQHEFGSERQRAARPGVLDESRLVGRVYDDVRPESLNGDLTFWIRVLEALERRGRHDVDARVVE